MEFPDDVAVKNISVLQAAPALFLINFSYALLSLCLFRILCFVPFNSSFFVLYLGVGFPIGAYLAHRFMQDLQVGLRLACWTLPIVAVGLLGTGFLAAYFCEFRLATICSIAVFGQALRLFAIVTPFFVIWGAAEFIGYRFALRIPRLERFFYVVPVSGFLTAFMAGMWSIPALGLFKTMAVVPLLALLTLFFLKSKHGFAAIFFFIGVSLLGWCAADGIENSYVHSLFSEHTRKIIYGEQAAVDTSAVVQLRSFWGKYCHLSFFHRLRDNKLTGCYDGETLWTVFPDTNNDDIFKQIVFAEIENGSDICILGAGGGKQVIQALSTNPRSIVAVEVIPEILDVFKGDLAWANGGAYLLPVVETVAMDGLQYIKESRKKFDLIVLPSTEFGGSVMARVLFEPGQRLHTLDAFKILRERLKPEGKVVIYKVLDKNKRLFNSYAKTLKAAGFNVKGISFDTMPLEPFVLLASMSPGLQVLSEIDPGLMESGICQYVDFQHTPPGGVVITESSPGIYGIIGNFVPGMYMNIFFGVIAFFVFSVIIAVLFLPLIGIRQTRQPDFSKRLVFSLAGLFIGINALYLENGIVLWLSTSLTNPFAAFYVGTSVFLFLWGLSNLAIPFFKFLIVVSLAGVISMILSQGWQADNFFVFLLLVTAGSGFCFSVLMLRFPSGRLNLFVFDALGSFVGGLLGIWIPLIYGLKYYFAVLPWIVLATLVIAIGALKGESAGRKI